MVRIITLVLTNNHYSKYYSLLSNRNDQFKHFYPGNLNFQTYAPWLIVGWACTVQRYSVSEHDVPIQGDLHSEVWDKVCQRQVFKGKILQWRTEIEPTTTVMVQFLWRAMNFFLSTYNLKYQNKQRIRRLKATFCEHGRQIAEGGGGLD